jgi:uncharacterized phage protein gp47/JayE
MPFARPSFEDLRRRTKQDIMIRLPGTDALLRYNNLGIIGEVQAGAAHLLYGRLEWSFRQLFPDTAEGEFLDRWASIWGVLRIAATKAKGRAVWPAGASTAIPTGALVSRGDGTRYRVENGASVTPDETITVDLIAENFGAAGNAAPDVQLTLATTIDNVAPLGRIIWPGVAGGYDGEGDDQLLIRLLQRIRLPPRGGARHDYERWAMEVPGVTRAWVYPLELGPGTVVTRFMMDDVRETDDGIPQPGDVALVQAHIDENRPITATSTPAVAPIAAPLDILIAQLEPDLPEIRDNIETELRYLIRRETAPGAELYQNRIFAAINAAPGVARFRLLEPAGDSVESEPGHIIVLGEISYV